MRRPAPESRSRTGRGLLAALAIAVAAAIAWRVSGGRRPADPDAPVAGVPVVAPPARVRPPAPPSLPSDPAPGSSDPSPGRLGSAVRESVVRDAVASIRRAALQGDDVTVRALAPGLRNRKETSRRLLDEVLRDERNPAAIDALRALRDSLDR
jgi:hypothetical protein